MRDQVPERERETEKRSVTSHSVMRQELHFPEHQKDITRISIISLITLKCFFVSIHPTKPVMPDFSKIYVHLMTWDVASQSYIDEERKKAISELVVGDVIRVLPLAAGSTRETVLPQNRMPAVDGVVIKGQSLVDESEFTGEYPSMKSVGDQVSHQKHEGRRMTERRKRGEQKKRERERAKKSAIEGRYPHWMRRISGPEI